MGVYYMEVIKDIAAIVGCALSCISLLTLIVKPLRKKIINWVAEIADKPETANALAELQTQISNIQSQIIENAEESRRYNGELHLKIDKSLQNDSDIENRIGRVEKNVLDNESDRLKSELYNCGNRCRRGIRLYAEEFEHIRSVYHKYSEVLHCNHDGTKEWEFIFDFYNKQELKNNHID